jgi:hypothetical protein
VIGLEAGFTNVFGPQTIYWNFVSGPLKYKYEFLIVKE